MTFMKSLDENEDEGHFLLALEIAADEAGILDLIQIG